MSIKSVIVFIDYENIHISLSEKNMQIDPGKIEVFKDVSSAYGDVQLIVPIAQWPNYRTHEEAFAGYGINPFSVAQNVKNSSDIALVVECLISCYEQSYDVYVIYSGDGGFLPLVNALLNKNKEVIFYSTKGNTCSKLVQRLKDNHFWIEEAFKDHLIGEAVIEDACRELLKSIYFGLMKNGFQGRKQLFKFIIKRPEYYGELNEKQAGALIDSAIKQGLISEASMTFDGQKTRVIEINYDHPLIKKEDFITTKYFNKSK